MKPLTTKKAFTKMITERGIHNRLKITNQSARNYRRTNVAQSTMERLLKKAGWTKVPEQWQKPPAKKKEKVCKICGLDGTTKCTDAANYLNIPLEAEINSKK